jgi:hypothetical protein
MRITIEVDTGYMYMSLLVVLSTTLYVNEIGMGDVQTDATQLFGTSITSCSLI